jgi:hypothetical protein
LPSADLNRTSENSDTFALAVTTIVYNVFILAVAAFKLCKCPVKE